jgi:tRNA 2-thiocytidine biosynthesis protein TtcA
VFVTEDITARFAESLGAPVIPCGCSLRAGAVRRTLRDLLGDLEKEHPRLKESLLSAMGNIETDRLLDLRYLPSDGPVEAPAATNPLVVVSGD